MFLISITEVCQRPPSLLKKADLRYQPFPVAPESRLTELSAVSGGAGIQADRKD